MKILKHILTIYFLLLATLFFTSLSYAEGSVPYSHTWEDKCNTGAYLYHASRAARNTPLAGCLAETSLTESVAPRTETCTGEPSYQCLNASGAQIDLIYKRNMCVENSANNGTSCTCNTGFYPVNGECLEQSAPTPQQECEAQPNMVWSNDTCITQQQATCEALPSTPVNLVAQFTSTAQIDDTVDLNALIKVNSNGCEYIINQIPDTENLPCFTYQGNDDNGYCELEYVPTGAVAVASNLDEYVNNGTIDPPTQCVDGTVTPYGACKMDCPANTWTNIDATTCDPIPSCSVTEVYDDDTNQCFQGDCPDGQYRPTPSSACQAPSSCPSGKTLQGLTCIATSCPDGEYRTNPSESCIPIPDGQELAQCPENPVLVNSLNQQDPRFLTQCAINAGLKSFHVPSTDYCQYPDSFHISQNVDGSHDVCLSLLSQANINQGDTGLLSNTNVNLDQCPAGQTYVPSAGCLKQTTSMTCSQGKLPNEYGFCVEPDICLDNPNLAECQTGSDGGDGNGDNTDLISLLDGTKDIEGEAEKITSIETAFDGNFGTGLNTDGTANIAPESDAMIATLIQSDAIQTLYNGYEDLNPFTDLTSTGCTYQTNAFGYDVDLSICDEQDEIHGILGFFLFVVLLFSLRELIFERPA